MFEIILVTLLACGFVLCLPPIMALKARPRLVPGSDLELAPLGAYRRQYLAGAITRSTLAFALFPLIGLLYWHGSQGQEDWPGLGAFQIAISCLILAYLAGHAAAGLVQRRIELAAVNQFPSLGITVLPDSARLKGFASYLIPAGFLAAGLWWSPDSSWPFYVLAWLTYVLRFNYLAKQLRATYVPIAEDSSLAKTINDTAGQMGFAPKHLDILPSTLCNAGAYPSGNIVVTSALRAIASDREIAAMLAHQFCHLRHTHTLTRILAIGAVVIMLVGHLSLNWLTPQFTNMTDWVLCFASCVLGCFGILWSIYCAVSHRQEFACDQATAAIGLGPDLASVLTKLARCHGLPADWIGIDKILLTHPSLNERLKRLNTESSLNKSVN